MLEGCYPLQASEHDSDGMVPASGGMYTTRNDYARPNTLHEKRGGGNAKSTSRPDVSLSERERDVAELDLTGI